jgi:hypothetical protein
MLSLPRRILQHPLTRLVLSLGGALAALVLLTLLIGGVTMPVRGLGDQLLVAVLNATAVLVALLGVGRYVERRGPAELGLGRRGAARELGWGMLLGAGLMFAVAAVLALPGWFQWVDESPGAPRPQARAVLMWLAIFAAAGFFEELLFRGIAFRLLEEWLGSAMALAVSGALFGWIHMNNEHGSALTAATIALEAGLLLGGSYMLTRSLWFPTAVHIAWNWTQGVLLGVPVSGIEVQSVLKSRLEGPEVWTGGAFGVEAGGVSILLSTLVGVALVVAAARRGHWQPFLPRRTRSSPA